MDSNNSKVINQQQPGPIQPEPETSNNSNPQHRFNLGRSRPNTIVNSYVNQRNYDSDTSILNRKFNHNTKYRKNWYSKEPNSYFEKSSGFDLDGLRNWRRSVLPYGSFRTKLGRRRRHHSPSSDSDSDYFDVQKKPNRVTSCSKYKRRRRRCSVSSTSSESEYSSDECSNCETLKIFVPYEFNNQIIAKLFVKEKVAEVHYSLHSVTKNIIVKSIKSNRLSVIFHVSQADIYKVSAEIHYRYHQKTICESKPLDVKCHLKNKKYDLQPYRPCRKFNYGVKYNQIHTLYENVDDYFIEVGFNENDGYQCFLDDIDLSSRYHFKPAYHPDECVGENEKYMKLHYILQTDVRRCDLVKIANLFDSLAYVDYTSITPKYILAENTWCDKTKHCRDKTPNFCSLQMIHLAEERGLNILEAWKHKHFGKDVTIRMVSHGLNPDHEDLSGQVKMCSSKYSKSQRGTATAGVLVAKDNNTGIIGIAHEADLLAYENLCLDKWEKEFSPGDIVIISMELHKNTYRVPVTDNLGIWLRLERASSQGTIVLISAGFGNLDLSSGLLFNNHGDSGAVTVGSMCGDVRDEKTNFNHSSSVWTAQSQNVATTGYGDLFSKGKNRLYTKEFSGSPAALALVGGAVALILGKLHEQGISPSIWELRKLIEKFGYKSSIPTGLGVRPNVYRTLAHI